MPVKKKRLLRLPTVYKWIAYFLGVATGAALVDVLDRPGIIALALLCGIPALLIFYGIESFYDYD
jgi:4-hydroxybenzoate polyprenyltransferase